MNILGCTNSGVRRGLRGSGWGKGLDGKGVGGMEWHEVKLKGRVLTDTWKD